MASEMEFGLLGPLAVRAGRSVIQVPAGKQRALLAALLLRPGQVVSREELAEALWGKDWPASAWPTLQNYVKRLRQALRPAGDGRIETRPGGYLVRAAAGELDVARFAALQESARQAAHAGEWDRAADQLGTALSLWRGEPLADVPSELLIMREAARLTEMRLQAIEARIDAELHLGRYAAVIPELHQLTFAYPMREGLHALLMVALYRDGQQTGALAVYQRARQTLIEELGAEPGPQLNWLEQQILSAAPDEPLTGAMSAVPAPAAAGRSPWPVIPHQLPAPVRHFAGRENELAALTSMSLPARDPDAQRAVMITVIAGTAGAGKTALAVQWAHRSADQFPDGQLYVNLRGYDPGEPVNTGDALTALLRAGGIPAQDVPVEADDRATLYRSVLAGRRMLILLDNAGSAEQIRPLLPGTPGCTALITSRDQLTGLVARDGAQRLDLDLLSLEDAVALLRALIGRRADTEAAATEDLATRCARLPLALRIAAELAAGQPAVPLAAVARELTDERRLDLLDAGGDPRAAARAVFSWSCWQLDAAALRGFRLLGLHPGGEFDGHDAAALTGCTLAEASRQLDLLARVNLTQAPGPGRRSMHALLRAYAAEQAHLYEPEPDRTSALNRLFDYYVHTAAAALDTLYPARRPRRADLVTPVIPAPPVTDPARARAWLDGHRATMALIAEYAGGHGWPGHASRLSSVLSGYEEREAHPAGTATAPDQPGRTGAAGA